jgi:hypothetical protein
MSGTMIPLEGQPPDIVGNLQKWAQLSQTGAQTGLIGAQTAEAAARAGLTGAQTQTEAQRPAQVQAQTGLIGQETAEAAARTSTLIPAQAAAASGSAASSYATAAKTGQETYADRLTNLQNAYGVNQTGIVGNVPLPPGYGPGQKMVPIGPAIDPAAKPFIPPEGQGLLRSISPSEASAPNVRYVPPGSNRSPTFDPSDGHPGQGAAGLYQLEPGTWRMAASGAGVDYRDMSQANQDRAAWWLSQRTYHDQTGRDLTTDLKRGDHDMQITAALNSVWPSITGGSQQNQTGASFLARLRGTVQHEVDGGTRAPAVGIPGPDDRASSPQAGPAPGQTPALAAPAAPPGSAPSQPPSDIARRAVPAQGPAGPDFVSPNAYFNPALNTGLPIPKAWLIQRAPNQSVTQAAAGWNERRQLEIPRLFEAAAGSQAPTDPAKYNAGVDAVYNAGLMFNSQRQALLGHPEMAADLMQAQLPLSEQAATKAAAATAVANVQMISETRQKFAQAADAAQQQNSILNQMRAFQGVAGSGPLAPDLARIGGVLSQAGEAIGLGPSQTVNDWATLQGLQSDLLRAKVVGTGNVRAQSEWNILNHSIASISDPTLAFQTKALSTQAMNDFTQAKAAAYAESKMLPDQFEEKWNSFVDPMAFVVHRLATTPAGLSALAQIYNDYKQNGRTAEWNDIERQGSLIDRNGIYHLAPLFKSAAAASP